MIKWGGKMAGGKTHTVSDLQLSKFYNLPAHYMCREWFGAIVK